MKPKHNFYTVAEVIESLSKADPGAIVLVQRDPEGNGIHDLYKLDMTDEDELAGGKPTVTFVAGSAYLE